MRAALVLAVELAAADLRRMVEDRSAQMRMAVATSDLVSPHLRRALGRDPDELVAGAARGFPPRGGQLVRGAGAARRSPGHGAGRGRPGDAPGAEVGAAAVTRTRPGPGPGCPRNFAPLPPDAAPSVPGAATLRSGPPQRSVSHSAASTLLFTFVSICSEVGRPVTATTAARPSRVTRLRVSKPWMSPPWPQA